MEAFLLGELDDQNWPCGSLHGRIPFLSSIQDPTQSRFQIQPSTNECFGKQVGTKIAATEDVALLMPGSKQKQKGVGCVRKVQVAHIMWQAGI